MDFNFIKDNYKNILISSLGAFLCMYTLSYLNFLNSSDLWLIPGFGASLVLVMSVHNSPLAKPKNVFFGHILSALSGIVILNLFGISPFSIALGLSLAIMLMMITDTVHPPAGGNPIIAILGAKSFFFIFMPVAVGAIVIVIFAFLFNKIWKR